MAGVLVMEDAVVAGLLRNPKIVKEFPFLKIAAKRAQAPARRSGCGGCGGARKNRSNIADYSGIKAAIGNLPSQKKSKLKELLGVDKVRVFYTNARKQRVKLTF